MVDLIDSPGKRQNKREFTVSEISRAIKKVVEGEFEHIQIKGEIGRISFPRSGHVYLDLKDDKSVLAAVIWKGVALQLSTEPVEGLEVRATGRISTFGGQSKYQLIIESLEPAGVGALMAMLEKRKSKLAAEGLFDPTKKKNIPYLPELIGVITSPSGAVIRDITQRLKDRFPRKVLLWPVTVQGEKCPMEVAAAIDGFNNGLKKVDIERPDLIIVARGGGSLEDLWGFNDEILVRAVANSGIPIISAIGHETDTTLIDYASDKRAPTPSAAAELAVPVRRELILRIDNYGIRMNRTSSKFLDNRLQRLRSLSRALPRPEELLNFGGQTLDSKSARLPISIVSKIQNLKIQLLKASASLLNSNARTRVENGSNSVSLITHRMYHSMTRLLDLKKDKLSQKFLGFELRELVYKFNEARRNFLELSSSLDSNFVFLLKKRSEKLENIERLRENLGYRATLNRGYAVVRGEKQVLTSVKASILFKDLEIEFHDGRFEVTKKHGK